MASRALHGAATRYAALCIPGWADWFGLILPGGKNLFGTVKQAEWEQLVVFSNSTSLVRSFISESLAQPRGVWKVNIFLYKEPNDCTYMSEFSPICIIIVFPQVKNTYDSVYLFKHLYSKYLQFSFIK
jgi:hypothetical protein